MPAVAVSDLLRQYAGRWVALMEGAVVAAAETADRLYADLHSKQIRGATIIRAPAEDEPELVGLG
jgi:hypothetical protein